MHCNDCTFEANYRVIFFSCLLHCSCRAVRAFQNLLYVEPGFSRAADVHVRLALVFKTNSEYDLCVKVSLLLLLMYVCIYMDASTCSCLCIRFVLMYSCVCVCCVCVAFYVKASVCFFRFECTYIDSIDILFIYFLIDQQ